MAGLTINHAGKSQWFDGTNRLLRITLIMLLVVSVFDPADLIVHAKTQLFIAAWILVIGDFISGANKSWPITYSLLLYVTLFTLLLPLSSITSYVIRGGDIANFDGFQYFRAYLFLSLALLLSIKRIDVMQPVCVILTIMSVLIVVIYLATFDNEARRLAIGAVGDDYGVLAIGERSYGSFSYRPIYFQTSPLLVLPLAYWTYRFIVAIGRWSKLMIASVLAINMLGMFLSGTRNNMFASLLIPFCVALWYSERRMRILGWAFAVSMSLIAFKWDVLANMFSAAEGDNAIKLVHARDYLYMFKEWITLLFGQGLGARFQSTLYGNTSITELTYFDILRSYGLFGAVTIIALLLYPLRGLWLSEQASSHQLYIAYGIYLVLCISNPMLFSSNGMLLLALVLKSYFADCRRRIPEPMLKSNPI